MSNRDALRAAQTAPTNGRGDSDGMTVLFDGNKLLLPELPAHDNPAALCEWLTCVFSLNPAHPVTGAVHEGLRGPEGHIDIRRAGGAPSIRFEPASRINTPAKLIETLSWRLLPTDDAVHAIKADHCREISYVVRMLCGAYEAMTEAQEAEAIIGDLLHAGEPIEGYTTHGTSGQRYEAAVALRRPTDETTGRQSGLTRYLIDKGAVIESTGELVGEGELVVAVSDLQETARRHIGSSLPHGWLDARIDRLGWTRIELQGYGQAGRSGRKGPHARINGYRGRLAETSGGRANPVEPVNT